MASEGIPDTTLVDLAESVVGDQQVRKLGQALGFKEAPIRKYIRTNVLGGEGTTNMIFDFRDRTRRKDQKPKLIAALIKAELENLVDEFFPEDDVSVRSSNQLADTAGPSTSQNRPQTEMATKSSQPTVTNIINMGDNAQVITSPAIKGDNSNLSQTSQNNTINKGASGSRKRKGTPSQPKETPKRSKKTKASAGSSKAKSSKQKK